jgi:hypothetical protein
MITAAGSRRRWFVGCAIFSLAAAAMLYPVAVLELENRARGKTARIALENGTRFSVISQHSMYDRPVTEEFVADADHIVLKSVSSPSAAVREYFGIAAAGERHPVERAMREIVFRVAVGPPQRLRLGRVERSFLDFGDHGDRLVMRVARRPALATWLATSIPGS